MSGFITAPVFLPPAPPLSNGINGQVLTIVGGARAWATPGGGTVKQGYLGTYLSDAPSAGAHTNYNPAGFGAGVGRLDIDTAAGNVEIVSLIGTSDGQLLNITNIGPNLLQLDSPGFRFPGSFTVPKFDAVLVCFYGGTINLWCLA